MKIKTDFTTNSSSASFVIGLHDISAYQLQQIEEHIEVAGEDAWEVHTGRDYVRLFTYMDNFDMYGYLIKLGVDISKAEYWHS